MSAGLSNPPRSLKVPYFEKNKKVLRKFHSIYKFPPPPSSRQKN